MPKDHTNNRQEQLEGLRNVRTAEDFYEKLAAGSPASSSDASGSVQHYIPVPITIKAQLGSPTALAIGAFATTLTSLSFALMGWRGLSTTNAFIGKTCASFSCLVIGRGCGLTMDRRLRHQLGSLQLSEPTR